MKNLIGMMALLAIVLTSCASPTTETNEFEELAKSWIMSSYESKEAAYNMVSENMSDVGKNIGSRYIGFGFNYNADAVETDGMVVSNIIENGPASSVLKLGDKFISVNGIEVNKETIDNGQLSFRGKPGEAVEAVIMRNDESMSISVERGIVEPTYSKEQILENISEADAAEWGKNNLGYEIREIVADNAKRIVYVKSWDKYLDEFSGLEAESITLTRFEFDQMGKVLSVGNMTENELLLRQTGWSITR